jgi:hypothetical protein
MTRLLDRRNDTSFSSPQLLTISLIAALIIRTLVQAKSKRPLASRRVPTTSASRPLTLQGISRISISTLGAMTLSLW